MLVSHARALSAYSLSLWRCLCHHLARHTTLLMFTAGRGEGCRFVHVCRCMCGCCCVYQLSVSMVCMTPELADSHGSKVEAEPVWASWLKPTPAARTHTHKHMHWGGDGLPPYQTNITSGIRIQTEIHWPQTHTRTHKHWESQTQDLLGHKTGLGCSDAERRSRDAESGKAI